jgi:hypothetical protein
MFGVTVVFSTRQGAQLTSIQVGIGGDPERGHTALCRSGRPHRRRRLIDFHEILAIDLHDVAALLRAQKRPHDGDQLAVGALPGIQELDHVIVGAGEVGAGGVAVLAVIELESGAVRIGAIQADLVSIDGFIT